VPDLVQVRFGFLAALAGPGPSEFGALPLGAYWARSETVNPAAGIRRVVMVLAVLVASFAGGLAVAAGGRSGLPTATAVPRFGRVVVIVFENKSVGEVLGSGAAPTFDRLAGRYATLTDYHGVAHPSLPNYLALVSGSSHGISSDCTDCAVSARNLADTLEQAGRAWKTYAEGLPRPGFTGATAGRYAKKHDPFLYFRDVVSEPRRLRRIVPLDRFRSDLLANRLPAFSLVVPDLCHDMHDCPVSSGDSWLASFLPPLLRSPALRRGVVFVVFDEGEASDSAGGGGHVPALVLGPLVRPGSRSTATLDHYDLLRTIEQSWRLPLLGESATARPITGIWRRQTSR
jgi:acid phosphatase